MNQYKTELLQEEEVLYSCCGVCGGRFPMDELTLPPIIEKFYRTFLLKVAKGEYPQLPDDVSNIGIFCRDCRTFKTMETQD